MAEIIFMPVCSNCKRIIFDKAIGFLPGIGNSSYSDDSVYDEIRLELRPGKCPYCNAPFDVLRMLPSDFLNGSMVTAYERADDNIPRKYGIDVFEDMPVDVNVVLWGRNKET